MNDIYQQIWNSDSHKFLVSPRDSEGKWLYPDADILLDEQIKAFGRRDLDLAQKPLFYRVNETKFKTIKTYISLINLLDNYRFNNQQAEIVTKVEKAEIEQFIDDVCQTKVMKIARQYINNKLKFKLSPINFRHNLKSIWFDLYTNYFGDIAVKDASGFEHIFVGEGKYDYPPTTKITGAISGYHSWIKFYLDEKQQRVDYFGHNYDLQGNIGMENPYVVTLQMLWQEQDKRSNLPVELLRKKAVSLLVLVPNARWRWGQ